MSKLRPRVIAAANVQAWQDKQDELQEVGMIASIGGSEATETQRRETVEVVGT